MPLLRTHTLDLLNVQGNDKIVASLKSRFTRPLIFVVLFEMSLIGMMAYAVHDWPQEGETRRWFAMTTVTRWLEWFTTGILSLLLPYLHHPMYPRAAPRKQLKSGPPLVSLPGMRGTAVIEMIHV